MSENWRWLFVELTCLHNPIQRCRSTPTNAPTLDDSTAKASIPPGSTLSYRFAPSGSQAVNRYSHEFLRLLASVDWPGPANPARPPQYGVGQPRQLQSRALRVRLDHHLRLGKLLCAQRADLVRSLDVQLSADSLQAPNILECPARCRNQPNPPLCERVDAWIW